MIGGPLVDAARHRPRYGTTVTVARTVTLLALPTVA
jgi:hypothetical protein